MKLLGIRIQNKRISPNASPKKSKPFPSLNYYSLFWIFVICSIFDLFGETLISYPVDGMWKNRYGLIWGPFSPIYGLGAVILTVTLCRFTNKNPILIFVLAALIGAGFELVVGWLLKNFFGIVAWSYLNRPLNIGGYTCLEMALMWGVIGLVWIKVALPLMLQLMDRIPHRILAIATALGSIFMFINICVTLMALNFWYLRLAGVPIDSSVQALFSSLFGDAFMEDRFEVMSVYAELANRSL